MTEKKLPLDRLDLIQFNKLRSVSESGEMLEVYEIVNAVSSLVLSAIGKGGRALVYYILLGADARELAIYSSAVGQPYSSNPPVDFTEKIYRENYDVIKKFLSDNEFE